MDAGHALHETSQRGRFLKHDSSFCRTAIVVNVELPERSQYFTQRQSETLHHVHRTHVHGDENVTVDSLSRSGRHGIHDAMFALTKLRRVHRRLEHGISPS